MDLELVFSAVGMLSFTGWIALLASPWIPTWSDRIAGVGVPALLASVYLFIVLTSPTEGGGFGSFAEITELFANPGALMAGWIHFLAFDLVVGAWECRTARDEGMPFWSVLPCLPLTFLLGPAGFLLFCGIRAGFRARQNASAKI